MLNLYKDKAVLHSLVWLMIYLLLNTITGNLAGSLGLESYLVSSLPNLLLSVVCLYYLMRSNIAADIGLLTKSTETSKTMLFYFPLLIITFLNLFYGINTELSPTQILAILCMYLGVGFMEEIIFRGLMLKALTKKWNHYAVVLFISLTFAFGHAVSIVAIDQSVGDTVLQIINAFVVGFLFTIVVVASGNLTICVITHILYNFMAEISLIGSTNIEIILISFIITLLYTAYLLLFGKNMKAYFKISKERTI